MKTLTEKTKLEMLSYIPFTSFNKKIRTKMIDEDRKYGKHYFGTNTILNILSLVATGIYVLGSVTMGTPNFTKWKEIGNKRSQDVYTERQKFEKDVLNKTYNYFDSNLDGVISKEEFKEGVEKGRTNTYTEGNFYDELNYNLNLNIKTREGK